MSQVLPSTTPPISQTPTSYPSRPSSTNPRVEKVVGGFVFNNATCVAWGSRIGKIPLNPEIDNHSIGAFCLIVKKVEAKPYNAYLSMLGEKPYKEYIIITQSKPFYGWRGMDPKLIPKFEEGRREALVRELLEAEGELCSMDWFCIDVYHPL